MNKLPPNKFPPAATAWFIESAYRVREVIVVRVSGDLATVRFADNPSGGIRIPVSRLYVDRDEALRDLKKKKKPF